MTDVEIAKKFAEESISLAISMYNPKAEIIAETACLYGLTFKNKRIAELEKENAELKEQIGDVIECFTSSSIGDDFEMAESAREVMEVLNMQCYRHGKVKSKLTEAKEIIREYVNWDYGDHTNCLPDITKKAEQFLKENK